MSAVVEHKVTQDAFLELKEKIEQKTLTVGIIGLGYVGLPVFVSLKKKFDVTGYDVNKKRVYNLNNLVDTNKEFSKNDLKIKIRQR